PMSHQARVDTLRRDPKNPARYRERNDSTQPKAEALSSQAPAQSPIPSVNGLELHRISRPPRTPPRSATPHNARAWPTIAPHPLQYGKSREDPAPRAPPSQKRQAQPSATPAQSPPQAPRSTEKLPPGSTLKAPRADYGISVSHPEKSMPP